MFRIAKTMKFDASHRLLDESGQNRVGNCSQLHGHCWKIEVVLEGSELDDLGMLVNFKDVKEQLRNIIACFDHAVILNTKDPLVKLVSKECSAVSTDLGKENPTAENFAKYIFRHFPLLKLNVKLRFVKVWETEDSWAQYDGE